MVTLAEIRKSGKGYSTHYLLSLWVFRPISYYVAWLCIKLGMSANQVTAIGGIIGIAGCVLFAFGSYWMIVAGAFLIVLAGILDCVDGAVARVTGTTSNYGHFLDLVSGYVQAGLVPLSIGLGLYFKTNIWLYLVFGGLYAFSKLLGSAITLTYDAIFPYKLQNMIDSKSTKWGVRIILLEIPTLIVCVALNSLEVFLVLFTLLFTCKAVVVMLTIIIRKECGK